MKTMTTYFKISEPNSQFAEPHRQLNQPTTASDWNNANATFEEKLMSCECRKSDKSHRQSNDVKPQKPHLSSSSCQKSSSCVARRQLRERCTFTNETRDTRRAANSHQINGRRRWSAGKVPSCSQVDTLHQLMSAERRIRMLELGNLYSLKNLSKVAEQKRNELKLQQISKLQRKAEKLYEHYLKAINHLTHEVDKYRESLTNKQDMESMKKLSSLLSSSTYRRAGGNLESSDKDDESSSIDAAARMVTTTRHSPTQQNLQQEKSFQAAVEVDRMTTTKSLRAIEKGSSSSSEATVEEEKSLINCPTNARSSLNQVAKDDSDKRRFDVSRGTLKLSTKSNNASAADASSAAINEQESSTSTLKDASFQIYRTSTFLSSDDVMRKAMEHRRRQVNGEKRGEHMNEIESSSLLDLAEDDSEEMLNETVRTVINFTDA